jgi:hypothetical protein
MHRAGDFSDTALEEMVKIRDLRVSAITQSSSRACSKIGCQDFGRGMPLAHVDCDIYDSIKFVLREIDTFLSAGAYVVLDDPLY